MNIIVRNKSLQKVDFLDVFKSLIWTDRYSKVGDFELSTEANKRNITSLQEDYYLTLEDSDRCMIIESINLETDVENGDNFIVKGRSLESILERRIVWKQTMLSGNLQNGIKILLDENAISPEDPDRKINNLIFEESVDPLVTSLSIDQQYFGENLYEIIKGLCELNNIGFKITLNSTNQFVFKLFAGVDRSFSQIINPFVAFSSELENLSNTKYFHAKTNYRTMTLVAGTGEGADRITTQVVFPGVVNTDLDRREKFTDASDVSFIVEGYVLTAEEYYTLLYQRGIQSLLESRPISSFEGEVDPIVNYVFGIDFFIGDIVQISNDYGLNGKSRVIEVIHSQDDSGIRIYPGFEMIE